MELLGNAIMVVGMIGAVLCGLWLLVAQFQTSILWGLACIFIPFASLVWLVSYWEDGKAPFLLSLGFAGLIVVGVLIAGGSPGELVG